MIGSSIFQIIGVDPLVLAFGYIGCVSLILFTRFDSRYETVSIKNKQDILISKILSIVCFSSLLLFFGLNQQLVATVLMTVAGILSTQHQELCDESRESDDESSSESEEEDDEESVEEEVNDSSDELEEESEEEDIEESLEDAFEEVSLLKPASPEPETLAELKVKMSRLCDDIQID